MSAFPVVIHHNPDCGALRNVLGIIHAAGYETTVIEHVKEGWMRPQLLALFAAAGITVREALRLARSPADQKGLAASGVTGDRLPGGMTRHPTLVHRPIVRGPKGVRPRRPSETTPDLLERPPPGPSPSRTAS